MINGNRDNFNQRVKDVVAKCVGFKCCNPECRIPTSGPSGDRTKCVNIGVAAHICAAAPGGPRYDPKMTSLERSSKDNAIWLCQNCSKLIDSDEERYAVNILKKWKKDAENSASQELGVRVNPRISVDNDELWNVPIGVLNKILQSLRIMKNSSEGLYENRSYFKIVENPDDSRMVYEQAWVLLNESRKIFKIEATWGLQLRKILGYSLTEEAFCIPSCFREDYYGDEAISRTAMAYLEYFQSGKGSELIEKCDEAIKCISSLCTNDTNNIYN